MCPDWNRHHGYLSAQTAREWHTESWLSQHMNELNCLGLYIHKERYVLYIQIALYFHPIENRKKEFFIPIYSCIYIYIYVYIYIYIMYVLRSTDGRMEGNEGGIFLSYYRQRAERYFIFIHTSLPQHRELCRVMFFIATWQIQIIVSPPFLLL